VVIRGVGKLSHSLLGLSSIHGGFPPIRVGEEDGLRIGDGDMNWRRNWSMEQLPRTLGEGLHLLSSFHLLHISSIS